MDYRFKDLANEVLQGDLDPLVGYAILKDYEQELKAAMNEVKSIAIEESEKYDKIFSHQGYNFERRNGRAIYDFSDIVEIVNAKSHLKELEIRSKQALKHIIVDDTTGEVIQPPKVKFADDVLVVRKV